MNLQGRLERRRQERDRAKEQFLTAQGVVRLAGALYAKLQAQVEELEQLIAEVKQES